MMLRITPWLLTLFFITARTAFAADDAWVVTLQPDADAERVAKDFKLKPKHRYRHVLNGFAGSMSDEKVRKLKKDKRVKAVEPDAMLTLCDQTNPLGILRMGITNFPVARINGRDERIDLDIAVIDTGIQTNHPDLNVFKWVGIAPGTTGDDTQGHGTAMAGFIGALDNDFGVVGVAPGVRLWSVAVSSGRTLPQSAAIAGMDYVAANADKISVVNMSFGGLNVNPTAMRQAILGLVNQGIVVVAATGNSLEDIAGGDGIFGTIDDAVPAALPEVMAVSAMIGSTLSDSSNYSSVPHSHPFVFSPGAAIDVAAPAGGLTTSMGSGYRIVSGTSAAAAHVTGLVALYISANGRAHSARDVYRIRQAIIDNSLPQSEWGRGYWDEFGNYHDDGSAWTNDPDNYPEPLAIPSENWVPKPRITSASTAPGGFQIGFACVPGYAYTVQYCTSLASPILWTNLTSTNAAGSVAAIRVTDPTPDTARFYRLVRQPAP